MSEIKDLLKSIAVSFELLSNELEKREDVLEHRLSTYELETAKQKTLLTQIANSILTELD